jgi:hypothetical protein
LHGYAFGVDVRCLWLLLQKRRSVAACSIILVIIVVEDTSLIPHDYSCKSSRDVNIPRLKNKINGKLSHLSMEFFDEEENSIYSMPNTYWDGHCYFIQ